ncbi:MAG: hypothetical protein ACPGLV_03760 [Bacteroidia bacterium]
MLKKWLKYTFLILTFLIVAMYFTKPSSEKVIQNVSTQVPANSRIELYSERDYFLFNSIQIEVQEPGNMFVTSNSYILTYMGVLGQTIDLSEQFK